MTAEGLLRLAESLGLGPEDLDEAVHELAQEIALGGLNALGDPGDQEGHIAGQEATASDVNNGGLGSQLSFLLAHCSAEQVEGIVRRAARGA
jgi:hypothetical protein